MDFLSIVGRRVGVPCTDSSDSWSGCQSSSESSSSSSPCTSWSATEPLTSLKLLMFVRLALVGLGCRTPTKNLASLPCIRTQHLRMPVILNNCSLTVPNVPGVSEKASARSHSEATLLSFRQAQARSTPKSGLICHSLLQKELSHNSNRAARLCILVGFQLDRCGNCLPFCTGRLSRG